MNSDSCLGKLFAHEDDDLYHVVRIYIFNPRESKAEQTPLSDIFVKQNVEEVPLVKVKYYTDTHEGTIDEVDRMSRTRCVDEDWLKLNPITGNKFMVCECGQHLKPKDKLYSFTCWFIEPTSQPYIMINGRRYNPLE
jgi:hypothetical protein